MTRLAAIFLGISGVVLAQAPLVNTGPRVPPVNTGVNILFPNGNVAGHATNLGTSVSGLGGKNYGFRGPHAGGMGQGRGGNRTIVIPYGVPVYYGGDPSAYGPQEQQASPNVTMIVPPQQTPTVIINQNYTPERANPVLRDYSDAQLPETVLPPEQQQSNVRVYQAPLNQTAARPEEEKATIFLIALKDGTIHSAIGYWVEGNTFGYVSPNASVNRVRLDQVDNETSQKLNRDRNLEFDLKR